MSKVLYDLSATQPNKAKFHGGAEYSKTVFLKILSLRSSEEIVAFYDPTKVLDTHLKKEIKKNGIELVSIKNNNELASCIDNDSFRVFYSGLPYSYYNIDIKIPKVIFTIHGLRVLECHTDKFEHKYLWNFKEYIRYAAIRIFPEKHKNRYKEKIQKLFSKGKETTIIVPSLHTKYSLKSFFPSIELDKIKVLYSPEVDNFKSVEISAKQEDHLLQRYNLEREKYFLITSSQRWVKNAYRTIKAIDQLYTEQSIKNDFKTVVLGYQEGLNFKSQLRNPNRFIFEGYVSFENLAYFYKNALAFVYPTLNEGFGYPPLESMRFETPVACSNISSVSEICGDAVHYLNPYSVEEIKNRLLALLYDQDLRNDLKLKSKVRYRKLSHVQEEMLEEISNIILDK